jgi:hypothetical protein
MGAPFLPFVYFSAVPAKTQQIIFTVSQELQKRYTGTVLT